VGDPEAGEAAHSVSEGDGSADAAVSFDGARPRIESRDESLDAEGAGVVGRRAVPKVSISGIHHATTDGDSARTFHGAQACE
jgi:hypothetical protein